jgi:hypothetical protein
MGDLRGQVAPEGEILFQSASAQGVPVHGQAGGGERLDAARQTGGHDAGQHVAGAAHRQIGSGDGAQAQHPPWATRVPAPFKASTCGCVLQKRRAALGLSACNSPMPMPRMRAISPGCGVSTAFAGSSAKSPGDCAKGNRASAS